MPKDLKLIDIPSIEEMNFEPLNGVSLAHYWVRNWPGRGGILARSRNVEYFLNKELTGPGKRCRFPVIIHRN